MPDLLMKKLNYWTDQFFASQDRMHRKYGAFKSLIRHDRRAHSRMAAMEEIFHDGKRVDFTRIAALYEALSGAVGDMVADLNAICPACYKSLRSYYRKFDNYIRYIMPGDIPSSPPYVLNLGDLKRDHLPLAGAKSVNLGRIGRNLELPVPDGFVVTTHACQRLIEANDLRGFIDETLSGIDPDDPSSVDEASETLCRAIREARVPDDIADPVSDAFGRLRKDDGADLKVAVRSSALGEDDASSFAGQFRSVMDVAEPDLLDTYKEILAGKYRPRALDYRITVGLSDGETPMAVMVIPMIDARASGVLYTRSDDNAESDVMRLHAVRGMGERLVSGEASPERITLSRSKPPRVEDRRPARASDTASESASNAASVIEDPLAETLGDWGLRIESLFNAPQDIEWCENPTGRLTILQARPLRMESETAAQRREACRVEDIENEILLQGGECAASGVGAGRVFLVESEEALSSVPEGAILVTRHASPRLSRVINRVEAVVTERGSAAGHFASIARESGTPLLVDVEDALNRLRDGRTVTVHADDAKVYDGRVDRLLRSPCKRPDHKPDTPYIRRLRFIMNFVSPLRLKDPGADVFKPEGCRSLHDIIRFAHEKAVQEMFQVSDRRFRKIGGAKPLDPGIPMRFYVLDVDGGLAESAEKKDLLEADDIASVPMTAVLKGLKHPDIEWGEFHHFDWAEFDRIAMSGGIASADDPMFASHAVVAGDYANINFRFGYHFTILDSLCGDAAAENYVQLRFTGGGSDLSQRIMRVKLIQRILERLEYEVSLSSDLLEAQLQEMERDRLREILDWTGRLLGATRLMDMYIKDESQIDEWADAFMAGRYNFASVDITDKTGKKPREE